jgi:hypothetical protein
LIEKDLIAFDGTFFQVLSLPRMVVNNSGKLLKNRDDMEAFDLATIKQIMSKQLSRDHESTHINIQCKILEDFQLFVKKRVKG